MSYFPSNTITLEAALRDLSSRSPKVRAAAAHALGDVLDPTERARAVAALLEVITDPQAPVRVEAVLSLGDLESEAAVEPLIGRLTDLAPVVRQSAAVALGRLGFSSALEALAEALADGPPDLRVQAATSLAEIDPQRAYEPLVAALRDGDGEVAGAAAVALGAIGDRRAADHLAGLLDHAHPRARFDAGYALAELGDARGQPVLLAFVEDKHMGWDAIDGLRRIGDARAADALAPLLARVLLPWPTKLRVAAAVLALAPEHAAADQARRALVAGLGRRKLDERGLAVQLCGEVGGDWAVEPLRALARGRGGRHLSDEIDEVLERLSVGGARS
jgi:HEAT repeat protein